MNRLKAIKELRDRFGLSLQDAADAVRVVESHLPTPEAVELERLRGYRDGVEAVAALVDARLEAVPDQTGLDVLIDAPTEELRDTTRRHFRAVVTEVANALRGSGGAEASTRPRGKDDE